MTPAVLSHKCLPLTSNKNGPDLASTVKQDIMAATSVTNLISIHLFCMFGQELLTKIATH